MGTIYATSPRTGKTYSVSVAGSSPTQAEDAEIRSYIDQVEGFGVGVMPAKPTSRFNYADIIKPDTTATGASWETVTKSVHVKPKEGSQTEFSTTFKLKGGLQDREALAKYRDEWTSDTPLGASMRFKTSADATSSK